MRFTIIPNGKTGPKLTFKTYNYRLCDTSMPPKTADYFPPGGVIATLLGNCKMLCYANMNVTLYRVLANQISVFFHNTTESVQCNYLVFQ